MTQPCCQAMMLPHSLVLHTKEEEEEEEESTHLVSAYSLSLKHFFFSYFYTIPFISNPVLSKGKQHKQVKFVRFLAKKKQQSEYSYIVQTPSCLQSGNARNTLVEDGGHFEIQDGCHNKAISAW